MFCVECGREIEIFKEGSCIECYIKRHKFTEGPCAIDIPVCIHCNSYKYKNTWYSETLQDILEKIIKNNFKISRELEKVDINVNCKETKHNIECKILISGYINKYRIVEEHNLIVHLKRNVCDVCSRQRGGYYEAIIQVRTDGKNLSKDELKNIENAVFNFVENLKAEGNRSIFITDIGFEHGGLDFYLSDKNVSLTIVKRLQEQYGGTIKQSPKLVGMKNGKTLYRMTYLLRLPSFKKHSFIKFKNSLYQIISIHGNRIKMINLETWEEISTKIDRIESSQVIGGEEIVKKMIVVSQNKKEIQLMDENTYEIKTVKKPKEINFKNEKINVINVNSQTFLLIENI